MPASIRFGGLLAAVGGVLSALVLFLTPSFGGRLEDHLTGVAGSTAWSAAQFVGIFATAMVVVGGLAVTRVFDDGPGEPYAAFARPVILIGGTASLVSLSLGLVPMRSIAQNFVLSTEANRQSVLDAGFSMNATLFALDALTTLMLIGIAPVLIGMAVLRGGTFPRWLAVPALLGGAIEILIGAMSLLRVDADLGFVDTLGSVLAIATVVALGVLVWRPALTRR